MRDFTNSQTRLTLESASYNKWEFSTGSWYIDTGASLVADVYLVNTASTYNVTTFFDAVQLEANTDMTPFAQGSMASGYSWSGSANKSATTRQEGRLYYSGSYFGSWENLTISTWLRMPFATSSKNRTIVSRRVDTNNRLALSIDASGHVLTSVREGAAISPSLTSTCVVADEEWHHVAATYQSILSGSTTVIIYVDGASDASALGSGSGLELRACDIDVGNLASDFFLNGYLDDLFIANRAYTSDEIKAIYTSNVPVAVHTNNFETMWTGHNSGNIVAHAGGLFGEAADGTKSFAISNESIGKSWGGFTLEQGDLVMGQNSASSAAIFWDKSSGCFGFFGSGSTNATLQIITGGELIFGSGSLVLSSCGIAIRDISSSTQNRIRWEYKPTPSASIANMGYVYGDWSGAGLSTMYLASVRNTGNPWVSHSAVMGAYDYVAGSNTTVRTTNDGHIALSGSVIEITATAIDGDGLNYIESSCYAKIIIGTVGIGQMTYGLTLSQGGADDEIFALITMGTFAKGEISRDQVLDMMAGGLEMQKLMAEFGVRV